MITRLKEKFSFRMGPPPAFGKPLTGGKSVAVAVADAGRLVAVAVAVGSRALQTMELILLVSRVTAPFRARALPSRLALVFRVMLVNARIFPWNEVVVPSVAELPTFQNTLHPDPLLIMTTDELLAVVIVLPIWKTKTELGLPWASRVSAPVN